MHCFDEEFPLFVISICHFDWAEFFAIRIFHHQFLAVVKILYIYRRTALVCADHHYHQTEAVGVESIIGYIMTHIVRYELSSSSVTLQASVVLHLVLTKSESSE